MMCAGCPNPSIDTSATWPNVAQDTLDFACRVSKGVPLVACHLGRKNSQDVCCLVGDLGYGIWLMLP
jgi:hypothetical protein